VKPIGREALDTWIRQQLPRGKPRRQAELLAALARHLGAAPEDVADLLRERLQALEIGLVIKRLEQRGDNPRWLQE
jgi:hypothetical protein